MRVREPELTCELGLDPRKPSIDLVVGFVPALGPGFRHPTRHLALLGDRSGKIVVEEQRDVAVELERAAARFAEKHVLALAHPAATDRAAKDLEHACVHRAPYDSRLSVVPCTVAHSRLTALRYGSGSEEPVQARLSGRRR